MSESILAGRLKMSRYVACVFLLGSLTACYRAAEPEWARNLDAVTQQFESIRQAQAQDPDAVPPEARETFENMRGTFTRMGQMNSTMMQSIHGRSMMGGRGMMGRRTMSAGMFDPSTMMQFRELNQQMLSYSLGMQRMMGRAGHNGMADMYGEMANRMQGLLSRLPPSSVPSPRSSEETQTEPDGPAVFATNCASCHGVHGEGLPGAFPPLNGSTIVSGAKDVPIAIVLHGLQGPLTVAGQSYDGVMPAFGATLSDAEIAAALSFARSLPNNGAGSVTASDVGLRRSATAPHNEAFTTTELGIE